MDTNGNTNKKDIFQYLHLYLGCECIINDDPRPVKITGMVNTHNGIWITWVKHGLPNEGHFIPSDRIKLRLRPLSSMSEEEAVDIALDCFFVTPHLAEFTGAEIKKFIVENMPFMIGVQDEEHEMGGYEFTPLSFILLTKYLLSKGFDIFNLHESGLCIYESDLKS